MATVDWYFDFVSPFAYLQSEQLHLLGPKTRVRYRPVLFAGLLARARAQGTRPRFRASARSPIASRCGKRGAWRSRSRCRTSIRSIRCRSCDLRSPAIARPTRCTRIFRFVWRDGRLPDLPIEWAELAADLRLPDAERRIADPEVKAALRRNTDEAIARGVFGVPTLMAGDELFWGNDATAMCADYLAQGGRWTDPEYERVATLPIGAERKVAEPEKKR